MARVLLDTGPLVAFASSNDAHHDWVVKTVGQLKPPFLTCEAVLAEASFIITRNGGSPVYPLMLLERGLIQAPFRLEKEYAAIRSLMERYRNVPMALADACLVRMAELYEGSAVLTLDSNFTIFRKNGREQVLTIMP